MRRTLLFNSIIAALLFLLWCVLDYCTVRVMQYPEEVRSLEWVLYIFPAIIFLPNFIITNGGILHKGVCSICYTIIVCVLELALISSFGVWFHFSIGGNL